MTKLPEDLPDCTVFLLGKAYQKAHGDFQKRLKPYGLTNMQHLVLEGLWYQEGVTAAELGKCLILDKATLSGVLDRMAEAGWIIKKQDSEDLRVQRLYPSPKANEMKDKLIGERKSANEELLASFTLEEQVLLKRLLRDIL
ncbi:MarR-type HTH domain-containing protein [Desulfonema limicola]|uniref:MarR-type HTH domain-containing protein n=1 Tax=Desulfonema limicola TaxID=45656 RepID=A0A975GHT5_9BACT|nr:MarR family transcriptional regulator [Desulfonema limicola]QTA81881.1 MarR-type HTH domain-containing protein [Desulfonema limicola]